MKHSKNLVLIGMPGSGKSTLGKIISEKLKMKFVDTDDYIEEKTNLTISDLFKNGEEYFRKIETQAIFEIIDEGIFVIAAGGGIIKKEINMAKLNSNSVIFFLNRNVNAIINNDNISNRPLIGNHKEKVFELYNERIDKYKKYCHFEIENNGNIKEAADEIINIYLKVES